MFLFAYAFLGPLHYLTEISWLHDRQYFAKGKFADSTLKINNLDQLKNKIIKVIIIVLIVKFFEKVLKLAHNFSTPNDLLLFSVSILAICIGYYLINRK